MFYPCIGDFLNKLTMPCQVEVMELPELAERRQRLMEQGPQLRARVQESEQQRRDQAAELRL